MRKTKFYVVGSAQHGKDEVGKILIEKLGIPYYASSKDIIDLFLFKSLFYLGYETPEALFEDRDSIRPLMYESIKAYNRKDPARVARGLFKVSPVYVGLRDDDELKGGLEAFDDVLVIYVDASDRKPIESTKSFNIPIERADEVVDNNIAIEDEAKRKEYLGKQLDVILAKHC